MQQVAHGLALCLARLVHMLAESPAAPHIGNGSLQYGDFPAYSQACTDGHVAIWAEHKKGVSE